MKDDDCGCGHTHGRETVRGLKPDELHGKMKARGWSEGNVSLESGDKKHKATIWTRETPARTLAHNDTLLTLEVEGEVQMFRLSVRPLELVLSGKIAPA